MAKCKAAAKKSSRSIVTEFPIQRVKRSAINPAAYNPRKMGTENKAKLRKGLEEFGLVEPLVWNQKTGNLVGGHQRLSVLDDEFKRQDYEVPVTVVDLDEAREKALNVALNNPELQGDWDYDKLRDVLIVIQGSPIDAELTGFDQAEIRTLTVDMNDPDFSGGADFHYGQEGDRVNNKSDVPFLMIVFEGPGQLDAVRKAFGVKKGVKRIHLAEAEIAKRFFEQLWEKQGGKRKGRPTS